MSRPRPPPAPGRASPWRCSSMPVTAAAREAAAARAALGGMLAGIELGNEPDAYMRHGLREAPWTFVQYAPQAQQYVGAIAALSPRVPLAGPDVSGSAVFGGWGGGE